MVSMLVAQQHPNAAKAVHVKMLHTPETMGSPPALSACNNETLSCLTGCHQPTIAVTVCKEATKKGIE